MRFLACALVLVIIAATNAQKKVCEKFENKIIGSSACYCLSDGTGWVCAAEVPNFETILKNPYIRKIRQAQSVDKCEPGRRFNYYCNACICSSRGTVRSSRCTRIWCDKKKWNKNGTKKTQ